MAESKPVEEPKVVAVNKTTMDALLEKLTKQEEDIKMLKEVADKSRMFNYEAKHADYSLKTAKISIYNGRPVMAWRTVKDEVYQDSQGRWHESQKMEIITEDNTRKELDYIDFVREVKKVDAIIMSRFVTPEGKAMMRVDYQGKQVDLDESFVN
jgi:hypothetical protein